MPSEPAAPPHPKHERKNHSLDPAPAPGDTYPPVSLLSGNQHVRASRESTLLELAAVHEGDIELAEMGARYSRNIWHHWT